MDNEEDQLRLKHWLMYNPINEKSLKELIDSKCNLIVNSYLLDLFNNRNMPTNMRCFADYLELDYFQIIDVKESYNEIIDGEIYISGIITIEAYVDAMVYNGVRELEDERYLNNGSTTVYLELEFSLQHKGEEGIANFEICKILKFEHVKD